MPTYNYKCKECEESQDVFMRITETESKMELDCPVCEKKTEQVKQVVSGNGFQLKGNGWFNKGGY